MSHDMQQDIDHALTHIRKAERSQGPMNDEQRRELLGDKTDWVEQRIWAVVDAIDEASERADMHSDLRRRGDD